MKAKLFFLSSLFFLLFSSCAEEQISDMDSIMKIKKDSIPFVLTEHNNIVIQAVLNQVDTLDLMFHTAVNSVSVTTTALEKIESFQSSESDTVKSWGGEQEANYSENNSMSIGAFSQDSLLVWVGERSGHLTDGKFGPNFFNDKILEINFDKQNLFLYDSLPPTDEYQKLALTFDRGSMFLKGKCLVNNEEHENSFMIHSGYSGTLLLDDGFSSQHHLSDHLEILSERQLSDSYGNTLTTKKAMLPGFKIAGLQLDTVPIAFFEGTIGNQKQSVLGSELLKRFNIIFDKKNKVVYLKPNHLMSLPLVDV